MSPGHAVLPCRRLPDFVVATDATTRCRRERIPTAMESAIRARFVRDSFHSLITALSRSGHGVIRQCGVVDLACFAQSGLLGLLLERRDHAQSSCPRHKRVYARLPTRLWRGGSTSCTRRARRAGESKVSGGAGEGARQVHAAESQSVQLSPDNLRHSALVAPPVWRLPGMVEAGILRKRDAHGSRRCFAPTARAKGAARTLICYPLSASPRSMQKAAG
jgi:hypothetical protein